MQLRHYLKGGLTGFLTFPLFPLHVSGSEGVDISSGYPSILPSSIYSSCICPASAPAMSCTVTVFHACQSCIFYVPLCPLQVLPLWFRAGVERGQEQGEVEALGGRMPPSFLLLNDTAEETPAGTCKGKSWDVKRHTPGVFTEKTKVGSYFWKHTPTTHLESPQSHDVINVFLITSILEWLNWTLSSLRFHSISYVLFREIMLFGWIFLCVHRLLFSFWGAAVLACSGLSGINSCRLLKRRQSWEVRATKTVKL